MEPRPPKVKFKSKHSTNIPALKPLEVEFNGKTAQKCNKRNAVPGAVVQEVNSHSVESIILPRKKKKEN